MDRSDDAGGGGRTYGGESAEERALRRRDALLDAGLEVFGTTGYRTATVRVLCRQAGLTDRYFYAAFDTLEDLLAAVYEREMLQLQQEVASAVAVDPVRQDFGHAIRPALDAVFRMAADPRVARVCWLEVLGVSPRIDALYNDYIGRFARFIVQTAWRYLPGLSLPADEELALGIAGVGAVSESVKHWLLSGYRQPRALMVATTARLFDGLMLTLQADRGGHAGPAVPRPPRKTQKRTPTKKPTNKPTRKPTKGSAP